MAEPSRPTCAYNPACRGITGLLTIEAAPSSQLNSGTVGLSLCSEHAQLIAATRTQISDLPPRAWADADRRSLELLSAAAAMILAQNLNPAEDLDNPPSHWATSRPKVCP